MTRISGGKPTTPGKSIFFINLDGQAEELKPSRTMRSYFKTLVCIVLYIVLVYGLFLIC